MALVTPPVEGSLEGVGYSQESLFSDQADAETGTNTGLSTSERNMCCERLLETGITAVESATGRLATQSEIAKNKAIKVARSVDETIVLPAVRAYHNRDWNLSTMPLHLGGLVLGVMSGLVTPPSSGAGENATSALPPSWTAIFLSLPFVIANLIIALPMGLMIGTRYRFSQLIKEWIDAAEGRSSFHRGKTLGHFLMYMYVYLWMQVATFVLSLQPCLVVTEWLSSRTRLHHRLPLPHEFVYQPPAESSMERVIERYYARVKAAREQICEESSSTAAH